jgi:pimeloyl-ACP methyl ester carboxylesterase
MKLKINYCRAPDGVRIAYATVGSGPPLVKTANWMNHVEYDWEGPIRFFLVSLARDFTLLRYDARGNGLSDWEVDDLSLDAWVSDLETVVNAAGLASRSLGCLRDAYIRGLRSTPSGAGEPPYSVRWLRARSIPPGEK